MRARLKATVNSHIHSTPLHADLSSSLAAPRPVLFTVTRLIPARRSTDKENPDGSSPHDDDSSTSALHSSSSVTNSAEASSSIDLYHLANCLFVLCATGYLLLDLSRVLYPQATLNDIHGSNWSNGGFLLFSVLYVFDCTLYFLVYNQWERDALMQEEEERTAHGMEDDGGVGGGDTEKQHLHDQQDEEQMKAAFGAGGVSKKKRKSLKSSSSSPSPSSSPVPLSFSGRLFRSSRRSLHRVHWCFFSHEGGLVNVLEICAALIFTMTATMTFFAGVANVERSTQKKWDMVTMTGDTIASAIFLSDSIVFQHIYARSVRAQQEQHQAKLIAAAAASSSPIKPSTALSSSAPSSISYTSFQPHDPYFWSSLLNVLGCLIYFIGALWGILQQRHISSIDDKQPTTYNTNMLPMLQKLHAIYLSGDVVYVACGCILVYAYSRDRRQATELEAIEDPDGSGDGMDAHQRAQALGHPHGVVVLRG